MFQPKTFTTFAFFIMAILALTQICDAQDSPSDYVNAHNHVRESLHILDYVVWERTLADYAQRYANTRIVDCALTTAYKGINLAKGSSMNATSAVQQWLDEKAYYDYPSNTCARNKHCAFYTQLVWRKSNKIGCAKVRCNNGDYLVVCSYSPPGNVRGERPY